jgi:hypothetical protein
MPAAGAALANSSAQTIISGNTSTNPPYQLPSLNTLWGSASYGYSGRALRIVARGTFGTTSAPTLTVVLGLNTAQGTATPAITLAATGAFTAPTTITNGNWELEIGIDINSIGITTSSLDPIGKFCVGPGNNAATAAASTYMIGSATSVTTVNPQTSYWVELAAKWGTANASNTIQCLQFEVLGLN